MTTIRVQDGFRYTLSEEDFLWLGRSLDGEGPNVAGYVWAYVQKWAGIPRLRREHPTLAAFVRAYSQPVNPIWQRGGTRCPVPVAETDCDERLLRRRAEKSSLHPSQFAPEVKAALAALRAGVLPNPVGRATDFATCERVERQMNDPETPRRLPQFGGWQIVSRFGGCFVSTTLSRSWPDDWVTIDGTVPRSSWAWGLGAFALALVVGGGWLLWRSR